MSIKIKIFSVKFFFLNLFFSISISRDLFNRCLNINDEIQFFYSLLLLLLYYHRCFCFVFTLHWISIDGELTLKNWLKIKKFIYLLLIRCQMATDSSLVRIFNELSLLVKVTAKLELSFHLILS